VTHPIVAALRSAAAEERLAGCEAAAGDPSAVLLVDPLVAALGDRDARVVRAATRALEQIGREHESVLVALQPALRSEDPRHRLEAAWTWARLEPPPIKLLPAIVSALGDLEGDARWRAARLLVELGRMHGEVAPVVRDLAAADRPARVRGIGLAALRELEPDSELTRSAHLAASRDADAGLARLALLGLAGLAAPTSEVRQRFAEVAASHADPGVPSDRGARARAQRRSAAGVEQQIVE
jgi:HEAT repeat protein